MSKVLVIGGGAAGMLAAVFAAENGNEVHIFEKNEKFGKKIYITGKGRCNLTNACDMDELFQSVCRNEKFLYSAFYGYTNQDVIDFFENSGCMTKIERGNRVFPVSDHASDVIGALVSRMKKAGVHTHLNTTVTELMCREEPETSVMGIKLSDGRMIQGDRVIVTTGGMSYPSTGSTGDGFRFARRAGHRVTELLPSLVPFEIKEEYVKELQGLSLKNVQLTVSLDGKRICEDFGEMLFTHFGISGPLVLTASSHVGEAFLKQKRKADKKNKVAAAEYSTEELMRTFPEFDVEIDLKPALSVEQLEQRILRDFEEAKNKQFKNILGGLFPSKLIPVMIQLSGIPGDKQINSITKEERQHFIKMIKHFPMTLTGLRSFKEAIITKGGVSVKEVNPSTMESKICNGLYFAGEVLDLDAVTGGFNLQISWSTAYLAGTSV